MVTVSSAFHVRFFVVSLIGLLVFPAFASAQSSVVSSVYENTMSTDGSQYSATITSNNNSLQSRVEARLECRKAVGEARMTCVGGTIENGVPTSLPAAITSRFVTVPKTPTASTVFTWQSHCTEIFGGNAAVCSPTSFSNATTMNTSQALALMRRWMRLHRTTVTGRSQSALRTDFLRWFSNLRSTASLSR